MRTLEEHPIVEDSALGYQRTRILKNGDVFAVFDACGCFPGRRRMAAHGLYLDDMRHLSRFALTLNGYQPVLLGSTVSRDNEVLRTDLSNPDFHTADALVPGDTCHLHNEWVVHRQVASMRATLTNFGHVPLDLHLEMHFDADFIDLFEVRGLERSDHGELRVELASDRVVRFVYEGLDGIVRTTSIRFPAPPSLLTPKLARFEFNLEPNAPRRFECAVACENSERPHVGETGDFARCQATLRSEKLERRERRADVHSSNPIFDEWVRRSHADLEMLVTHTPHGPYPFAGTPWYSTAFGRDGLITALQTLDVWPTMARGVLQFLAEHQALESDEVRDAEPGKILHEMRQCESAHLAETPFSRYYGSIDSTPLFIHLTGEYLRRTADLEFVRGLWPNVERGVRWIDAYGDRDGDGYVEYGRRSEHGLEQQGWKDSHDSVFHSDGRDAPSPIALCEVQAYVFAARRSAALIAERLGKQDFAAEQSQKAEALRQSFERDFWSDAIGMYALALDGDKRPCVIRTSNAGHCLAFGIASPERARTVVSSLMSEGMFCGWGVRTVGQGESRYNPLSYHNGSIWPHDNGLVALGFSRYGYTRHAARLLDALFAASDEFELHRLPELFCGFPRQPGEGPVRYPVACSPQAWAAGTVYMLIKAALGLDIDLLARRVVLRKPRLPEALSHLRLSDVPVGDSRVDLMIRATGDGICVETRGSGDLDVVIYH